MTASGATTITMSGKRAGRRRKDRDVRHFWPWYERTPSITEVPAEPPPFTLEDIRRTRDQTRRSRRPRSVALVVAAIVLVFLLWTILF
jgi:hypothetical protein